MCDGESVIDSNQENFIVSIIIIQLYIQSAYFLFFFNDNVLNKTYKYILDYTYDKSVAMREKKNIVYDITLQ